MPGSKILPNYRYREQIWYGVYKAYTIQEGEGRQHFMAFKKQLSRSYAIVKIKHAEFGEHPSYQQFFALPSSHGLIEFEQRGTTGPMSQYPVDCGRVYVYARNKESRNQLKDDILAILDKIDSKKFSEAANKFWKT